MSEPATVLNTPPPAPVPLHPVCKIVGGILAVAFAYCVNTEFLQPGFLNPNSNHYFHELSFYAVLVLLSTPHVVYMYIWWAPNRFSELATKNPIGRFISGGRACDLMHACVTNIKLMQFTVVILWRLHANDIRLDTIQPMDVLRVFDSTPPVRLATAIALFSFGQLLNFGVYNAIGKDGVNYGFKLGAPGPWVTTFPYNLGLRHAQYIGCIMSLSAFYLAFITPRTFVATSVQWIVWASYYIYSSWMEASSDFDTPEEKVIAPKVDKAGILSNTGKKRL